MAGNGRRISEEVKDRVQRLVARGFLVASVARACGVSTATVYNLCPEYTPAKRGTRRASSRRHLRNYIGPEDEE